MASTQSSCCAPCVLNFSRARSHLIAVISSATAMRTGIIMNFTLSDYESGRRLQVSNDSNCIFTVAAHETSTVHGSAVIAWTSDQAKLLKGYIVIRSQVRIATVCPHVQAVS